MRPRPLPLELHQPFHVREADTLGIPRRRLAARDLSAPFHGVRQPQHDRTESIADRCRTYLPRLTGGQFFSHLTAAALWGMPLPFTPTGAIHVSAIPPAREPRTRGVVGHRISLPTDGVTLIDDLPVSTRLETWAHLAGDLRFEHLVAAADWLLAQGEVHDDIVDCALRPRRRGAVALREAAGLARPGAESPRESIVRVALVGAGLPEPRLNWTLHSASGAFVARLDMAYPDERVAVEYDGRQHANLDQFRRDADRWRAIQDEGWTLIRILAHHLESPERDVIAPVRLALRAAQRR